jgi:hypothetical protein
MIPDEFFLAENGATRGPFTLAQLKSMWGSGALTGRMLYWQQGFDEWRPLSTIAEALERRPEPRVKPGHEFSRNIAEARARMAAPGAAASLQAMAEPEDAPPSFAVAVLTFLLPIIGIIVGVVWICNSKQHYRDSGVAMLVLGVLLGMIYSIVFAEMNS